VRLGLSVIHVAAIVLCASGASRAAEHRTGIDHWAFKSPVHPAAPSLSGASNPIDAFIRARLQQDQLAPSHKADRRTLIRRVCFDLTGLPPAPEEIAEFAADPAPDAYEKLVDRLLA
jgi:hypothetical protein